MKNRYTAIAGSLLAACAMIFPGCSNGNADDAGSRTAANFATKIETRAAEQTWEGGEQIGIFMIESGQTLSVGSIAEEADNREYTASAGLVSTLTAVSKADRIYFPRNGDQVDFVAYHPFLPSGDIADYSITADVSDQSVALSTDLLYSDNAKGASKSSPHVEMTFRHAMSRIIINTTIASEFDGAEVNSISLTGFAAQGIFSLASGEWTVGQTAEIVPLAAGGSFTAHMIPQEAASGRSIVIDMGEKIYTHPIAADRNLPQNASLVYNLTIGRDGVLQAEAEIGDWADGSLNDQTMLPKGQLRVSWDGYNDENFTAIEIQTGDGMTYASRVAPDPWALFKITTDLIAYPEESAIIDTVWVYYMNSKFEVPAGGAEFIEGMLVIRYWDIMAD